jgi:hypothetical protein
MFKKLALREAAQQLILSHPERAAVNSNDGGRKDLGPQQRIHALPRLLEQCADLVWRQ